jgi:hypothetical protein
MEEIMKIKRAVSVSGGTLPRDFSIVVPVEIDYSGCTDYETYGWASSNRVIAIQRTLRNQSVEFLRELAKNGLSVHARECGQSLKSPEERVAELVGAGVPEALAKLMVDDPEKAAALMSGIGK